MVDTVADVFGGEENERRDVRQFVGLLRGLTIDADCGLVLSAHPSLTGINSGTGLSGSTGWHNSVRARAYLKTATTGAGEEPPKELRELQFLKNNYGPLAERMLLRWRDGVFDPEPRTGSIERLAADLRIDDIFLKLLGRFNQQERNVNPNPCRTYAPTLFVGEPEAAGIGKSELAASMRRLFAADKIHVETVGPPSHQRSRLIIGGVNK
jgi:RecA-family ATPase